MKRATLAFLTCALASLAHGADYTALDRYIAAPDASYRYTLAGTVNSTGPSSNRTPCFQSKLEL